MAFAFYLRLLTLHDHVLRVRGEALRFETKFAQAVALIRRLGAVFPAVPVLVVCDSCFGNNGLFKPLRQELGPRAQWLSRLRTNAALYDLPTRTPGVSGRPRKYGARLGHAAQLAATLQPSASSYTLNLYGKMRTVIAAERVVMHKTLRCQVRVVWVFRKTQWLALVTTDLDLSVAQIIEYYGARWKIEAGFREIKQEIGSAETQTRNPDAVTNHLTICMAATAITWIYGASLEHAPPRRYATHQRTEYAFADLRRRLAQDLGGEGVRSKLMWLPELSRSLLNETLPVRCPLPVGPGRAQREHGLRVVRRPPRAGALEALLNHIAVGTFNLAGADRQALRQGALIIEMIEPVAQIAMARPYRGVRIGHRDGLQGLIQRGQDRDYLIAFQAFFLDLHPRLGVVGRATLRRVSEVIADMEEVHRITPLGAEARRDLVGDPHRPIAKGMDLGVRPQARRDGTGQQLLPSHLDPAAQGGGVDRRGAAVRMRQTQLGFLPQ